MSIRPEIPDVQGVKDEAVTKILRAMKSGFDSITGRSQPKITKLGSAPNFLGVVNKVNEVIDRLQSDPKGSAKITTPEGLATTPAAGTYNNVTVNSAGLVTTGSNVAYLTANQTIVISGDSLGTGNTAIAVTHAAVVTAGGPLGSGSTVPIVTWDAKGRITAVGTATVTPSAIGAVSTASAVITGTATLTNATVTGTHSGNSSGSNTGDQTIILTGDVTGTGSGSFAATLATVTTDTGTFGSASTVPLVTVNAKGQVTAVGTATIANDTMKWGIVVRSVGTAETMTIPEGYQQIAAGDFTNSGTINNSGTRMVI